MTGDGATIAYATDHEPFWNASGRVSQHPGDERHIAFLKGANLVIHDAQYTDAEYRDKVGWGHSSLEYAVDIALAAGVERLVLFHHDPAHNDAMLEQMEGMARAHVDRRGQALDVLAAREGLALEVRGSSAEPDMEEASALQHRQIVGGRVLVISANDPEVAEIEEVLGDDRLVFLHETDVASVLTRGLEHPPDIAIIDRELLDGRDDTVLDTLRDRLGRRNLPIIVLADSSIPPDAVYRGEASSTDYLSKPFSPPMLRTRVRAWLARTLLVLDSIERRAPRAADTTSTSESDSHTASPLDMVPLFGSLTPDQRDRLLVSAMERTFAPGQVLIRENDPPDRLFVILSGRVRVMEVAPDSPVELIVSELGEGEILGELSVLRNQPRSATIVAVERTHCLVLPRSAFLKVLQSSADLAVSLLRTLAGRLYETDRRLSRLAPDPVTGLAGRRTFHDQYRRLAAVARRRQTGALLLVVDVLQLRSINDRFGYGVGDDVLRTVGDALVESTRSTDLVVRHGGDEFVVFFPDASVGDVDTLVARVRDTIKVLSGKRGIPVTIACNFGVAYAQAPPESAEDLLREADQDMLRRKR
jgi:diguanylate cyclase (GGDEF)-like protein